MDDERPPLFVTLGMFIIDEFSFSDEAGNPTGKMFDTQGSSVTAIGGGGTYTIIGARIWLPPENLGMIVDRGSDFPEAFHTTLRQYGDQMWLIRDRADGITTRALNSYRGDRREFQYLTMKVRVGPRDLYQTRLARPKVLHFICSPTRASIILSEIRKDNAWCPITIYEPIPDMCVPSEMPSLTQVLPEISVLSPNAEEALSLLGLPLPPTKETIEAAADKFLAYDIYGGSGWVIIRSGPMGAYIKNRKTRGRWIDAFWTSDDPSHVVDVTGAGNAFLGGLAAGFVLTGDFVDAMLFASISASFVIEQEGLPALSSDNLWNGDSPRRRLELLRKRMQL